MPKITPAMKRVLSHLANGLHVATHCKTQSDYGGLTCTLDAMVRRGLLDRNHELTDEGRRAIELLWPSTQEGG